MAGERLRIRKTLVMAAILTLLVPALSAQRIKMATLSPEGSPWDTILKKMGERWSEQTDGEVTLTLYPGGVAGDEPDIIRKMRIGQYQAGAVSVSGLADIDKAFTVFEIPLFYRDFAEMEFVLDELTPTLSAKLEAKGFVLLGWGYVGWVHFFTRKPAHSLEEMQQLKIFTWAGDEAMSAWWRRNGFKPVALAATDILTGLETGMIDAVAMPPLYAMQMQYYKKAPHMADVGLAPMMGAILMSKRAWSRIDEADRPAVKAAGLEAQEKVFEQIPKLDETAIRLMTTQGMSVTEIEASQYSSDWRRAAERFAEDMRGDIVPAEIFDEAMAARTRHRAAAGSGPSGDGD